MRTSSRRANIRCSLTMKPCSSRASGTSDPPGEEGPLSLASRFFYEDSVFRTALLPRFEIRPSGESYDTSGLGGTEVQLTHRRRKIWENVNTDAMRLGSEPISLRPTHNVLILDGEKVKASQYVDQIAAGFEDLYRFLQARRTELLAPQGHSPQLVGPALRVQEYGDIRFDAQAPLLFPLPPRRH